MADRQVEILIIPSSLEGRYILARSRVTTNDTITLRALNSISARTVFKESDGTSLTTTQATNVITVTTASLTDEPVILIAWE